MGERIIEKPIDEIISEAFIDYAREVITARALPDARDGLKPVQRRILYGMFILALLPSTPYRKAARIVGEVLGKFHPHGDASVYDALVAMAQGFAKRYALVDGQGNFGTIDDSAAAMRYTEARLSKYAEVLLKDLEKDTVDWASNFDDSEVEPVVLPSFFPNLLVNGTSGIAVGMASEIPPHNLGEVLDGIMAYIQNPNITVKELMEHIKGPDFPTGAIAAPENLLSCYETGVGAVAMRAKVSIEELPDDRRQLIITELPYRVSKSKLAQKIAAYIQTRSVDDVVEIRDESGDREDQGINVRLVIEMDKGGNADKLLQELLVKTEMQTNYTYNMVGLINGKPVTMSLKAMIEAFVDHKKEVIRRRTEFDLKKAKAKVHVLEGLIRAVDIIDEVITTIRKSSSQRNAEENLVSAFGFTPEQAHAICEMRLGRLTALEIKSLQKELAEILKLVKALETILASEKNVLKEVRKELEALKEQFCDDRRTTIKPFDQIEVKTKIEKFTLQINDNGKLKKLSETYNGNKGLAIKTDTTQNIMLFDADGTITKFPGTNIPPTVDKTIVGACNDGDFPAEENVTFISSDAQIKKTAFGEYQMVKSGAQATKLAPQAKVVTVLCGPIASDIVLVTRDGWAIRFEHDDIRQMGRVATGVRGMKLDDSDQVVGVLTLPKDQQDGTITVQTTAGERPIKISDIRKQNRGGKGIRLVKGEQIVGIC